MAQSSYLMMMMCDGVLKLMNLVVVAVSLPLLAEKLMLS
jgi:hypothetical protein